MSAAPSNELRNGSKFLRLRLKDAFNSSNDIISGISSNISSRLSMFSNASSSSMNFESPTPNIGTEEETNSDPALPLHMLPDVSDAPFSPQCNHRSPTTVKDKIKETFKFENLKPAIEDFILPDESTEPSTLPTNTPDSSKSGLCHKISNAFNQSIPRKFEDYKALAIRTLSGEAGENSGLGKKVSTCAIHINGPESASEKDDACNHVMKDVDMDSTHLSTKSCNSRQSYQDNFPVSNENSLNRQDLSSGSPSENEVGCGASLDSSDSDPQRKLWIRFDIVPSSSQTSLQSWASSLSYDAEDINDMREFMKSFVDDIFSNTSNITVDRKAEFGKLAQTEQGRLWFARCINAKRGCKRVSEATFFSLIQHFAVMLFECAESDDFAPAKSLMNMCFTFYHEVTSPGGDSRQKEFVFSYLKQQPIWRSIRYWNAAFFDALQCERFLNPVATRSQLSSGKKKQLLSDELRFQENITFGQLGTFTCNMHAFGLSQEIVTDFLHKQVTIGSLREDQVNLLYGNLQRLYSGSKEWQ